MKSLLISHSSKLDDNIKWFLECEDLDWVRIVQEIEFS
jgi:hypothetical protein